MNGHTDRCPHCRAKTGLDVVAATPKTEPIALPAVPTPIRVHTADRPPQDCILHPDGTLTTVIGGEQRRNFMMFADMRERNWADAHIEFNPSVPVEEPDAPPTAESVQDALL